MGLVPVNYIDKEENVKLENGPGVHVNGKSEAEVSSEHLHVTCMYMCTWSYRKCIKPTR